MRTVLLWLMFSAGLVACLPQRVSGSEAAPAVTLRESDFHAEISDTTVQLRIPVTNTGTPAQAELSVELVDWNEKVDGQSQIRTELKTGTTPLLASIAMPLPSKRRRLSEELWYRVRYALTVNGASAASGIVSLVAVAPDVYEISAVHQRVAAEGQSYLVRVHAANPVTRKPLSGVRLTGTLTFEEDEKSKPISAAAMTNASGDAILTYRLPEVVDTDEGELKIQSSRAGIEREVSFDVRLNHTLRMVINTDKLLYQPGQSLHGRVLIFDKQNKALPDAPVEFTLRDPEGSIVWRGDGTTNKFGIASADWQLPDSVRLGDYSLRVELRDVPRYEDAAQTTGVRISRYDLPTFTVTAKLDKPYYLLNQNAELDVAADYLFGKPITRGSVRIVRQQERHWDFKQQKWIGEDLDEQRGELDANGRAHFHVSLGAISTELLDNDYRRYQDASYAAFVTDASTGRTEQRRIKVRVSRDPIHIYVTRMQRADSSYSFFVATSYPDGTPAQCQLWIRAARDEDDESPAATKPLPILRTGRTNRYGVARISDVRVITKGEDDEPELQVEARDRTGAFTRHKEQMWLGRGSNGIDVTTDKTLYAAKDTIEVTLHGPPSIRSVVLDVLRNDAVIWTKTVRMRGGNGFAIVPYTPPFSGAVSMIAHALGEGDDTYAMPRGGKTVLFPNDPKLRVQVATNRKSYRPGETVNASLRVTSSGGNASVSAVGVAVVDKAVEERVRSDEEFGSSHYGFWDWGWWHEPTNVGGISREDLDSVDVSQPVDHDLDLAADYILNSSGFWDQLEIERDEYASTSESLFRGAIQKAIDPLRKALLDQSLRGWVFATNKQELDKVAQSAHIDVSALRDPWGEPYHFKFSVRDRYRSIEIMSAGPDKQLGTPDDIAAANVSWNFFKPIGTAMDNAVKAAFARSGMFIRNYASLRAEMLHAGIDLDTARDPWGGPYRYEFQASGQYFNVIVYSPGPPRNKPSRYETVVWTSGIDYFADVRKRLDEALWRYSTQHGRSPRTNDEFDEALAPAGIGFRNLRDPWGNPYSVKFTEGARYNDIREVVYSPTESVQNSRPVTARIDWIVISTNGPDGRPDTPDDVPVATFSNVVSEQSASDAAPKLTASPQLSGGTGAIEGVVFDPTGAVIPGATVTAEPERTGEAIKVQTDGGGKYLIRNLTPGPYRVVVTATGFVAARVVHIPVHSSSSTAVNVTLGVGAAMQTVEVQAEAVQVNTTSSSVAGKPAAGATAQIREQTFTPRLRDFFPETLYWEPSLFTTSGGAAKFTFKLADNITTWKMNLLASTRDGKIGSAEAEIRAFQPFFAELDPPKVLTVGDQIDLPVVVRNYLDQKQQVQVELKPADWFRASATKLQTVTVTPNDSATAVFPFEAMLPIDSGKQQIEAKNRTIGDAIVKPVSVHPNGREESRESTQVFSNRGNLEMDLPDGVVDGSLRAELKVYPNLLAHVVEGIEGSLHRPYGCGEQTISSTYPSLMMVRYYKEHGVGNDAVYSRAQRYLAAGYQRLLNYRDESGGFTYWGHGEPDLALTAYALRFLVDAAKFVDVDEQTIASAQHWLITKQSSDGAWRESYRESESLTAYVAYMLARSESSVPDRSRKDVHEAVQRALAAMRSQQPRMREPYSVASYALAAFATGDTASATTAIAAMRSTVHHEGAGTYWALETNTPFYGWGRAGRVEATALALQAIAAASPDNKEQDPLVSSTISFLLKEKDRFGVWYSGQATVNVLQALLDVLKRGPEMTTTGGKAEVLINVTPSGELRFPAAGEVSSPLRLDVTKFLRAGKNEIEIRRDTSSNTASAQIVTTYYMPWTADDQTSEATRPGESRGLRLAVKFDHTSSSVGDEVDCTVNAERIGHRGYGMLLAEIGLPPGVDVDRSSLDSAMKELGWGLSRYDVLPDKVIVYLWPQAGGSKFTFSFRPRLSLKALTAPSVIYDYYNPDEQLTLAPTHFEVTQPSPRSTAGAAVSSP